MHDLARYRDAILAAGEHHLRADPTLGGKLALSSSDSLVATYAPFEHINRSAKIVILGITPGRRQASDALVAARRALMAGKSNEEASAIAKGVASFAGRMRTNITQMMDHIGLHQSLGLTSTMDLFGPRSDLVHYTSCLRYPVLRDGADYDGSSPSMVRSRFLSSIWRDTLAEEVAMIPGALWVPLGGKVEAVVDQMVAEGLMPEASVLRGLQHASGANAERIAYFLGNKPREMLSNRTNPDKIDAGKAMAVEAVRAFRL